MKKRAGANACKRFADAVLYGNDGSQSWRLQSLTDLATLPDYEEGWGYDGGEPQGAPVDAEGNPIFYDVPDELGAAKNDGERWRWALGNNGRVGIRRGATKSGSPGPTFLESQFGVADDGRLSRSRSSASGPTIRKDVPQTWALDTLGEDETIARLATGIKRFKLPDEQNFIKLYQQVLADTAGRRKIRRARTARHATWPRSSRTAASIRGRPSTGGWRSSDSRGDERTQYQQRLDQIVGNWGEFGAVMTQPAGRGATVEFRFRNAKQVEFVAHADQRPQAARRREGLPEVEPEAARLAAS